MMGPEGRGPDGRSYGNIHLLIAGLIAVIIGLVVAIVVIANNNNSKLLFDGLDGVLAHPPDDAQNRLDDDRHDHRLDDEHDFADHDRQHLHHDDEPDDADDHQGATGAAASRRPRRRRALGFPAAASLLVPDFAPRERRAKPTGSSHRRL